MGKRASGRASTKFVSGGALALFIASFSSCAILKPNVIEPAGDAPAPPEASAPGYAAVPHPAGLQLGDVHALFLTADAPKRESDEVKTCASDFKQLEAKTKSKDELRQGVLELVRKEPIRYHWCFYSKILELETQLKSAEMLDDRQRAVVQTYRFLAPLSRAFFREFHDSRYLRWAVSYYRRASELAFYRKVETSPALTQELIGAGGDDSSRGASEKASSVLEKYGIVIPERLPSGGQPAVGAKVGDTLPADAYVEGAGAFDPTAAPPTSTAEPAVGDRLPASDP